MNKPNKTYNKALQLTTKSGASLAFGSTELNRYTMKKITLIIATCFLLTSCGDKNREDAITYVKTVQMFLISKGVCKNNQDCTKKQFVFWEGAAPWKEEVNILVYGLTDKALAVEIEKTLKKKRQSVPHGLKLMVYSTKHLQPKIILLESTIK